MTKLRWEDPPKETDPANYDPRIDPKVRFLGSTDADLPSERQAVLNRLIEVRDALARVQASIEPAVIPDAGFLVGEDLERFKSGVDFIERLPAPTPEEKAQTKRFLAHLRSEEAKLEARLVELPRNDRFVPRSRR